MNNRGQTLVMFICLLPIFVFIGAYTIDVGYLYLNKNELNSINKMMIKYGFDHLGEAGINDQLADLLYQNDDQITNYSIEFKDHQIIINLEKTVDSIMGKALNINKYKIVSKYQGQQDGQKISYERIK